VLIGLVGSGLTDTAGPDLLLGFAIGPCPSPRGNKYQLGLGSEPNSSLLRSRNSRIAAHASAFSGRTRSPASVLLRRTVSVCSIKSTSRHCNPRISQARIVIFRARVAASRASCHSGLLAAALSNFSFSPGVSAWPTSCRSGSGLIGRQVRRGEHGVKVVTFVKMAKEDKETGEKKPFRRPSTTTVFHVSQTDVVEIDGGAS